MRAPWLPIGLIVAATGCASSTGFDEPVVDRPAAPQSQAVNLTLEEAGFLASGQLITVYGIDTDPVPVEVESEVVDYQDQLVWKLDITTALTDGGQRLEHEWRMWIGTPIDGPPAVLRAQRRS